jgi:hypothetical protein
MTKTYTGDVEKWGLPEGTILECSQSTSHCFIKGKQYEIIKSKGNLRIQDEVSQCSSVYSNFKLPTNNTIKSDGGSSSYYTLNINDTVVETEDIIRDVFGNDFDFGNAFKALVRAYLNTQGKGKAGNNLSYELNKIRYSLNKIKEQ